MQSLWLRMRPHPHTWSLIAEGQAQRKDTAFPVSLRPNRAQENHHGLCLSPSINRPTREGNGDFRSKKPGQFCPGFLFAVKRLSRNKSCGEASWQIAATKPFFPGAKKDGVCVAFRVDISYYKIALRQLLVQPTAPLANIPIFGKSTVRLLDYNLFLLGSFSLTQKESKILPFILPIPDADISISLENIKHQPP